MSVMGAMPPGAGFAPALAGDAAAFGFAGDAKLGIEGVPLGVDGGAAAGPDAANGEAGGAEEGMRGGRGGRGGGRGDYYRRARWAVGGAAWPCRALLWLRWAGHAWRLGAGEQAGAKRHAAGLGWLAHRLRPCPAHTQLMPGVCWGKKLFFWSVTNCQFPHLAAGACAAAAAGSTAAMGRRGATATGGGLSMGAGPRRASGAATAAAAAAAGAARAAGGAARRAGPTCGTFPWVRPARQAPAGRR